LKREEAQKFLNEKAKSKTMKKFIFKGENYEMDRETKKLYKDGKYVADVIIQDGKQKIKFITEPIKQINYKGIEYDLDRETKKLYKDGKYVGDVIIKDGKQNIIWKKEQELKRNEAQKFLKDLDKKPIKYNYDGIIYDRKGNTLSKNGEYVGLIYNYDGKEKIRFTGRKAQNEYRDKMSGLPKGWSERYFESGKPFYLNLKTGETQLTKPFA